LLYVPIRAAHGCTWLVADEVRTRMTVAGAIVVVAVMILYSIGTRKIVLSPGVRNGASVYDQGVSSCEDPTNYVT